MLHKDLFKSITTPCWFCLWLGRPSWNVCKGCNRTSRYNRFLLSPMAVLHLKVALKFGWKGGEKGRPEC
jgi:hypothetical protein